MVWAAMRGGLARFENGRWQRIGEAGYPAGTAVTAYLDSHGSLWVATESTVVYLTSGAKKFQTTGIAIGQTYQLAESPGGTLWMAETTRSRFILSAPETRNSSRIRRHPLR